MGADAAEPFFVAPPPPRPPRGRLLLIAYDFPPQSSAGSLRWQRLSTFAAERGWALDVITLAPSSQSTPDMARLHEIGAGTRVFGAPSHVLAIDRVERVVYAALRRLRGRTRPEPSGDGNSAAVDGTAARRRPASLSRAEILSAPWTPRLVVRS